MDLNLSLSGAPEMVAHDLLIAAFNALSATPSRSSDETEMLAQCQVYLAEAVVLLREVHPYLRLDELDT